MIINIWVDIFKENPSNGTLKLFTIVIRCFDVDISACELADFNSVIMFERIMECFKFMVFIDIKHTPNNCVNKMKINF